MRRMRMRIVGGCVARSIVEETGCRVVMVSASERSIHCSRIVVGSRCRLMMVMVRFTIAYQDRYAHPPRRRQPDHLDALFLARLLQLVAMVLEPDLDLRWCQAQQTRQV